MDVSAPTTSMDTGSQQPLNSVRSLLQYPFKRRTMVEKLNVKELGPDQPEVKISQQDKEKDKAWIVSGVTDMKHFSEKVKKHESSRAHMDNTVKLAMLGRANIAMQLDEGNGRNGGRLARENNSSWVQR
ncbi:uncharacterized protein [Nothobranchius furzeri]|uniref:uncharacterized protein isoform X2 n=1 Tax=Nothobranchius furzeri TaxID=105023 RepID=UPI003904B453